MFNFFYFFASCSCTLWILCVCMGLSFLFPLHVFIFSSVFIPLSFSFFYLLSASFPLSNLLHQSIFMFPLSFSSSSSLSSIPLSLDSISELDHGLSDISEDDDLVDDTAASHMPWALPSYASITSDQQSGDFEQHAQNPEASNPFSGSQTYTSEVSGVEEGCLAETRATSQPLTWWSWLCLGGVVKYVSFILGFLSMLGKNGKCLPAKLFSGLKKKLSILTLTVSKLISQSAENRKIFILTAPTSIFPNMTQSRLRQTLDSSAKKMNNFVSFFTSYLPTKLFPARALQPTQLSLPPASSFTCPPQVSALSPLSSLPFPSHLFSLLTPSSSSCSNLTASVCRYLLNPSPLFLPCLLVVFLLVVMLTASQSLVLALILATPLGLTLCYLENMVSSQRKAVMPMFISERQKRQSEDQSCSGFNRHAFSLTPPRIRHHGHTGATWTQEMCDPAAWTYTHRPLPHPSPSYSALFECVSFITLFTYTHFLFPNHPCTLPPPVYWS